MTSRPTPRLGVNIDHVATVRNARGGTHPDPLDAARAEVTTEGGRDARGQADTLRPRVAALRDAGIRVSLFIDPDPEQLETAVDLGAPVVELHTGAYAEGRPGELDRLRAAASLTARLGLECHAGHGLSYANVQPVAALPEVAELNIGHYLIGQAIFDGLPGVVSAMMRIIAASR